MVIDVRKRVVIYCRASTIKQEESTSLETQEMESREFSALKGVAVSQVVHEAQ